MSMPVVGDPAPEVALPDEAGTMSDRQCAGCARRNVQERASAQAEDSLEGADTQVDGRPETHGGKARSGQSPLLCAGSSGNIVVKNVPVKSPLLPL